MVGPEFSPDPTIKPCAVSQSHVYAAHISYVLHLGSLFKSDTVLVKSVYTGQGTVLAGSGLPDPCSEGMMTFLVTSV